MFNTFAEVIEAAQSRLVKIVNEIDELTVKRRLLDDKCYEMIQDLKLNEPWWHSESVSPEKRKAIADCEDQLCEMHNKIIELDDERFITNRFLGQFTDAYHKSKNIMEFMDYMQGITPAMRSGDAYDPFPNH